MRISPKSPARLLVASTALLGGCRGVHQLFKAHLVAGILIVLIIVLLIIGIIIKLLKKVPE